MTVDILNQSNLVVVIDTPITRIYFKKIAMKQKLLRLSLQKRVSVLVVFQDKASIV